MLVSTPLNLLIFYMLSSTMMSHQLKNNQLCFSFFFSPNLSETPQLNCQKRTMTNHGSHLRNLALQLLTASCRIKKEMRMTSMISCITWEKIITHCALCTTIIYFFILYYGKICLNLDITKLHVGCLKTVSLVKMF